MSKKSIFLFISILIIAFATGCKCSPSEIAVFEILLDSPPDGSIISSLTPTFNWHDNEGCEPDTFYLSAKINGEWGDYWNPIPGTGNSYALSSPLLPGREYVWSMLPQISGALVPIVTQRRTSTMLQHHVTSATIS